MFKVYTIILILGAMKNIFHIIIVIVIIMVVEEQTTFLVFFCKVERLHVYCFPISILPIGLLISHRISTIRSIRYLDQIIYTITKRYSSKKCMYWTFVS